MDGSLSGSLADAPAPQGEGPLPAYRNRVAAGNLRPDPAQEKAAERLQDLWQRIRGYDPKPLAGPPAEGGGLLGRLFRRRPAAETLPEAPKGLYLVGEVGRGKSMLMDLFFDTAQVARKQRIHFHQFMQDSHRRIHLWKRENPGGDDPIPPLADSIAAKAALLCFDEFQVHDITDAMILGRLLEKLFAKGVVLVMTSNYPPENLYPNGLQRQNFLPTIALLKQQLDVVQVEAGIDYRLRTLEQVEIYHYPADDAAEAKMADYFRELAGGEGQAGGSIEVLGREIPVLRRSAGVVWFDFQALCDGPRSQNDYLELARAYHTVLVSRLPRMNSTQRDMARRFTWLVDIFYDAKVKFIATAECEPEGLYTEGTHAVEFFRTVSRLVEMRSRDYLALPHLA